MENKVCDGCKVVNELEELNDTLVIRKDLLEMWRDQLEEHGEALEKRESLLDTWQDSLEKQARMNRRVMLFNIATSVILLGTSLVKLFVG